MWEYSHIHTEPYRVWEYYNQKCSLAQAFDIQINDKGVRDLPTPTLRLSKEELVTGRQMVSQVKEKLKRERESREKLEKDILKQQERDEAERKMERERENNLKMSMYSSSSRSSSSPFSNYSMSSSNNYSKKDGGKNKRPYVRKNPKN